MLVRAIMTTEVVTVDPATSIRDAALFMSDNRIGSVLILKNGRVVGIATEHDLLQSISDRQVNVDDLHIEDVMTPYVIYVSPNTTLLKAVDMMIEHKIKKLPVIKDDMLVGIVTSTDIVAAVPDMMKQLRALLLKKR